MPAPCLLGTALSSWHRVLPKACSHPAVGVKDCRSSCPPTVSYLRLSTSRAGPVSSIFAKTQSFRAERRPSFRAGARNDPGSEKTGEEAAWDSGPFDPTSTKVAVTAALILVGVIVFPRLAVLSLVAAERAIVSVLLSFEQAILSVGLAVVRWVALLGVGIVGVALLYVFLVPDQDLMAIRSFVLDDSEDSESTKKLSQKQQPRSEHRESTHKDKP